MSEDLSTFGQSLPSIGEQVRLWRLAKGLTQADLEQKAGLSHNSVSRIECGSVSPRLGTLEQFAGAMHISVEQLQFQQPMRRLEETKSEYDGNNQIDVLIEKLSKVPEPKRSKLLRTFQDLINLALDEDGE